MFFSLFFFQEETFEKKRRKEKTFSHLRMSVAISEKTETTALWSTVEGRRWEDGVGGVRGGVKEKKEERRLGVF